MKKFGSSFIFWTVFLFIANGNPDPEIKTVAGDHQETMTQDCLTPADMRKIGVKKIRDPTCIDQGNNWEHRVSGEYFLAFQTAFDHFKESSNRSTDLNDFTVRLTREENKYLVYFNPDLYSDRFDYAIPRIYELELKNGKMEILSHS